MTSAARQFAPLVFWQEDVADDSDDLVHIVCDCNNTLTLCGVEAEIDAGDWDESEECVVCVDLSKQPCERCGEDIE